MEHEEEKGAVWLSFLDLVEKHKDDHLPHELGYLIIMYTSKMMHDLIKGESYIKSIVDLGVFAGKELCEGLTKPEQDEA